MIQKRPIMLLLLVSILFSLAACASTDIHLELALCGSYAVPGMFCSDLKGGSFSCEILEEDSQGRILYEYTTKNLISGNEDTALVICQKIDDESVFYYEDVCFLLSGYSAQDVEQLKEANDWNAPLDESKLSRRVKNISLDLFIMPDDALEHKSVRQACIRTLQINPEQAKDLFLLDTDGYGKTLYLFIAGSSTGYLRYFIITDSSYRIAFMEIVDGLVNPDAVASFKQENGWTYGC